MNGYVPKPRSTAIPARPLPAPAAVSLRATRPWPADTAAASALQRRLAEQVRETGGPAKPYVVAGADLHLSRRNGTGVATFTAVAVPGLELLEEVAVRVNVDCPYIPGLLSFRELPPLLAAFERLRVRPDVVMVDGHGRAHPRGFGLACHLGLELDIPTVGCAKSRLVGESGPLGDTQGEIAALLFQGRRVGTVLRSKAGCKPLYISIGHRISLDAALGVVLDSLDGLRLPVPVRLAHRLAKLEVQR